MNLKIFAAPAILASVVSLSAPALGQAASGLSTAAAVTQTAILEMTPQPNVLRAGTEIPLIMREELTTKKKKLRVGQRFQMEVATSISMNGVVVIPGGTPAVGEITEVRNKGMWGKSGYVGARVLSLRMGDRHIRLTGTFDDKGVTGTGGVVASIALIPLAGFFTTGTSAMISSGSGVKAFLDEDIAFRPVAAQVQTIDVPVPSSLPASIPALTAPVPPAGGGVIPVAATAIKGGA